MIQPDQSPEGAAAACNSPEPEPPRPIPWEDPQVPRLVAWCRTLGGLLADPQAFFQNPGRAGGGEPLAFGLVTGTVGFLAALFWSTLLYAAAARSWGEAVGVDQVYAVGTGFTIFVMALSPVIVLFNLGFGAFCLWGAAAMTGAGRGFREAWRIYCYAQGAMVAGIIPVLGVPLAGLWLLALVYVGIQTVFRISGGRTLGVLVLFLFLQVCGFMLWLGTLLALLAFLGLLLWLG